MPYYLSLRSQIPLQLSIPKNLILLANTTFIVKQYDGSHIFELRSYTLPHVIERNNK